MDRHVVEWFPNLKQAKHRALECVGLEENQPLTDIVDIFECEVEVNKAQLLQMINHGGWFGSQKKTMEINQEGIVDPKNWT